MQRCRKRISQNLKFMGNKNTKTRKYESEDVSFMGFCEREESKKKMSNYVLRNRLESTWK